MGQKPEEGRGKGNPRRFVHIERFEDCIRFSCELPWHKRCCRREGLAETRCGPYNRQIPPGHHACYSDHAIILP